MKRLTFLTVALVLGIGPCLGCGKGGGQAQIPTEPGVTVKPEDLRGMDLGGRKKSTIPQPGK